MSLSCGYSEASLSSFIPFQSLALQLTSTTSSGPTPPCSPHLVALAPHPYCKNLAVPALAASSFSKWSFAPIHVLPCMLGAASAPSQQTASLNERLHLLPAPKALDRFGYCVLCCEKLEDQTHSLEPKAVTRAVVCSLLGICCSGCKLDAPAFNINTQLLSSPSHLTPLSRCQVSLRASASTDTVEYSAFQRQNST